MPTPWAIGQGSSAALFVPHHGLLAQPTDTIGASRPQGGQPWPNATRRRLQGFARKFAAADVALLAHTDALPDTLSGPGPRS